ncbi:hypothetical protein IJ847_02260 [Candidatus Saccharibacteria bacterium]|nr:hypothetical protein [Candidatus Saccharibacteria bacterium]
MKKTYRFDDFMRSLVDCVANCAWYGLLSDISVGVLPRSKDFVELMREDKDSLYVACAINAACASANGEMTDIDTMPYLMYIGDERCLDYFVLDDEDGICIFHVEEEGRETADSDPETAEMVMAELYKDLNGELLEFRRKYAAEIQRIADGVSEGLRVECAVFSGESSTKLCMVLLSEDETGKGVVDAEIYVCLNGDVQQGAAQIVQAVIEDFACAIDCVSIVCCEHTDSAV